MTDPIRVLLVDDQALIRIGFRLVLEAEPDILVVGEAGDGAAALAQTAALCRDGAGPDVVLMDVRMPGIGGLEATRKLLRSHPDIKVVVVTVCEDDVFPTRLLQAGASGYLTKGAALEEMVQAIRQAFAGRSDVVWHRDEERDQWLICALEEDLAENAVRYAGQGATFTLAVERDGDEVVVRGTDDGVGVDEAQLFRLFERFFRADRARASRGTGLGLAIVKHVVTQAGGSVEAAGGLGAGLEIRCAFPAPAGAFTTSSPDVYQ